METFDLRESFRYVHEPLRGDKGALEPLGNTELIGELRSRIAHSQGGAFLITGFRGVGKSTLVLRTLDEIVRDSPDGRVVVPVVLSVARSTSTDRLLFALIRRIVETLNTTGHLHDLPPETRHSLLLAYIRTSLSFKETQNNATEQSAGLELGGALSKAMAGTGMPVPKLGLSTRRSRSLATEASFLVYSETDVEYDLTRIIALLDADSSVTPRARRRWPRRSRPAPPRFHLIVVLDEVDKLTADDAGLAAVEELLSGIKNVLSATGAHFLVVAGTDLHDRAVQDSSRGNSVYESVFAWRMYVPCLWDAPDRLVDSVVLTDSPDEQSDGPGRQADGAGYHDEFLGDMPPVLRHLAEQASSGTSLTDLVDYLRFKARGVPRRLLQEFNTYVTWHDGRPYLELDDLACERIAFYAALERILADHFAQRETRNLFSLAVDNDRRRLGMYYVLDSVLRTEGEPFSATDLFTGPGPGELNPLFHVTEHAVEKLLDHLTRSGILRVVRDSGNAEVIIEDVADAQRVVYRLADDVQTRMLGIAKHSEVERAALEISIPTNTQPPVGWRGRSGEAPPLHRPRVVAGRYELTDLLGQGGMGQVYRGYDRLWGGPVAVKVLPPTLLDNDRARARFDREAEIAVRVRHPRIVHTLEAAHDPDLGPALVMELLNGDTLQERVEHRGPLLDGPTARLGQDIALALDYLNGQGLARIDLKPTNIILEPGRGPVIVDLGIARHVEAANAITDPRGLVGTPMYMAPEQLRDDARIDIRADIYTLGQVMYYCLAGHRPWPDRSFIGLIERITSEDVDLSDLPISRDFRQVLAKMLARKPEDRYQQPFELASALDQLSVWKEPGEHYWAWAVCPRCGNPVALDSEFCLECTLRLGG